MFQYTYIITRFYDKLAWYYVKVLKNKLGIVDKTESEYNKKSAAQYILDQKFSKLIFTAFSSSVTTDRLSSIDSSTASSRFIST